MNDKPERMPNVPPFVRFVASAVPMVFDNSLSYYEALCALWKYLQDMADVVNNNATLEEEFIDKVNELETYVNTYFDNLDVQQEINNKLDQMAQDGSFQPLLDITFRNYYNEMKNYTDEALENKVSKDGTGEVTYNNLSQSVKEMFTGGNTAVVGVNSVGKADIIDGSIKYQKLDDNGKKGSAGFNQKKYLNFNWEQGTRHSHDPEDHGQLIPSDTSIVCTEPFKLVYGMRITIKTGYRGALYTWTSGTYHAVWAGWQNTDYLIGTSTAEDIEDNEYYLTISNSEGTDISPSEGTDAVDITIDQTNIKPSYFSLEENTQKLLLGKTSTLKITDTFNIGNPIASTVSGFAYSTGPAATGTTDGRNRAWLNTPVFLPAGTTVSCTDDWEALIIQASSVPTTHKVYYPNVYGSEFIVQSDNLYYIGFRKSDNSALADIAGQFIDNLTISIPVSSEENKTIYVSGAGNDSTGDGSEGNPYRQITKALSENPAVIICASGYTYSPISLSSRSNLKIIGDMPTYSTGNRYQPKPIIDNSIALTSASLEAGKVKIPYVASIDSDMYACLVAKTKDLKDTYSQRSEGYYCTIFSDGNQDTAHRYIPVLVQDNVAGHFYYDGSNIYINPFTGNDASTGYSLVDNALDGSLNLANLSECNNIKFENITFKHGSRYLLYANKCSGIEVVSCEFCGSSQRDNLAVNDTNINISDSISYLARNDGFNFHGFGASIITKCIGCNCFDDGISHHDQCTHSIIGGEYYGNGKGGISSPTYGCSGDISGCYTHDNPYGIYSESNPARGNSYVNLNDNLIANNNIGIQFGINVTGVAYNNKLTGNTTDIVNNSSVVFY